MNTFNLSFAKADVVHPQGSRWRLRGADPVTDMWADVTVTKYDGMGYYCISPTISVQGGPRVGERPAERWVPVLEFQRYDQVAP